MPAQARVCTGALSHDTLQFAVPCRAVPCRASPLTLPHLGPCLTSDLALPCLALQLLLRVHHGLLPCDQPYGVPALQGAHVASAGAERQAEGGPAPQLARLPGLLGLARPALGHAARTLEERLSSSEPPMGGCGTDSSFQPRPKVRIMSRATPGDDEPHAGGDRAGLRGTAGAGSRLTKERGACIDRHPGVPGVPSVPSFRRLPDILVN